jgi:hypothetical protein
MILTSALSSLSIAIVLTSLEPKMLVPVVMDNDRSFFIFLGPFRMVAFSTKDSDDMHAVHVPWLRGDVRVWALVVLSLFVGDGPSAAGSARLPLLARGVGAGVGGWMLLR